MRVNAAIAVALSCVLGTAAPVLAQPQTFEQWFAQLKLLAKEGPRVDGAYWVRWRVTDASVPSPDDLAALRATVAGHPDHPDQARLARWERASAGRPDFSDKHIWVRGREFRRSDNPGGEASDFVDCAVGEKESWSLTPYQLAVFDASKNEVPGYALGNVLNVSATDYLTIATGGIVCLRRYLDRLDVPQPVAGRWSLQQEINTDGAAIHIFMRGSWDAEAGEGTIDELGYRRTREDSPGPAGGTTVRTSGWGEIDFFGVRCPRKAVEFEPTGAPRRRLTMLGSGTISSGEFARLIKTPSLSANDDVRGALTFRSILDYRPSKPFHQMISTDGTGEDPTLLAAATPASRRMEYAGWTMAGVLILTIMILRWRRSRPAGKGVGV